MNIKPIKTENDYRAAMARIDSIFEAKKDSPEGDELEVLSVLVEKYEDQHFPISAPDPIEAIKFRMDQLGYKAKDL